MTDLVRDLRFGGRMLIKSPVFTVTTVLLLAVGISANTLIFSVIDAWMLRPLPVSRPENLVRLIEVHPNDFITWDLPYNLCATPPPEGSGLSEMIGQGEADVPFSDSTTTERVRVHLVSPNFFSSLGVRPYLGRLLTAGDENAAARNAVLSYSFWSRRSSVIRRLSGAASSCAGIHSRWWESHPKASMACRWRPALTSGSPPPPTGSL